MGEMLERAIAALKTLPEVDRERIACEIIERVEDKTEWDRIISAPDSQAWLEKTAKTAINIYNKTAKKISMSLVAPGVETLLREDSYWESFDDLPEDVRKLAEKNFKLWKQNTLNPGLRFKQIHQTLPIFSFRVGMKHRTVGTETPDGKMVWFWVGSFETFSQSIEQTPA